MQDIVRGAPARNNFLCSHCGIEFKPRRCSARFCSSRCRLISHRSATAGTPATATRKDAGARVSVSGPASLQNQNPAGSETLRQPLPRGIVPDAKWPGMYRLRRPDGTLSDMVNLTRARDALAALLAGGAA
jgi:hypothetical protein